MGGYQDEDFKLVSQQYRAWSDCMHVQRYNTFQQLKELVSFKLIQVTSKWFKTDTNTKKAPSLKFGIQGMYLKIL
jgi:hypothetical protein